MKNLVRTKEVEGHKLLSKKDSPLNLLTVSIAQNEPKEAPLYLTRKEVAAILRVTLPTTYAWERAGILQSYRIGNGTRFIASEVLSAPKPINRKGGRHA